MRDVISADMVFGCYGQINNFLTSHMEMSKSNKLPAQNLQKLTNAVKMFRFVDKFEKNMVNLLPYESTQSQKFAIYPM